MRLVKFGIIASAVVATAFVLAGCAATQQQEQDPAEIARQATQVVETAQEVQAERFYWAELKFKKEEFTLDLERQLENEMAAEYASIPVERETYDSWQEGQELSRSGGEANFWIRGELAEYVVSVNKKSVENRYGYVDDAGQTHQITREVYEAALAQLATDSIYSVSTANSEIAYILDQPLEELEFTTTEPLERYFVTVEISNESFTLDIDQHILNELTKHRVTMEVPQSVYQNGGDAWEPTLSEWPLWTEGRFTQMRGRIVERWTETDAQFVQVTTADGRTLVLPASTVS